LIFLLSMYLICDTIQVTLLYKVSRMNYEKTTLILMAVAILGLFLSPFVCLIYREVVLVAIKPIFPDFVFSQQIIIARSNYYTYDGILHNAFWGRSCDNALAQVTYPDGRMSKSMPLGNALEYRDIFGGKITPASKQ